MWFTEDNKLHRDNGPAVERADGTKEWWRNGAPVQAQQEQGSTVVHADDSKERHRENDPAPASLIRKDWPITALPVDVLEKAREKARREREKQGRDEQTRGPRGPYDGGPTR